MSDSTGHGSLFPSLLRTSSRPLGVRLRDSGTSAGRFVITFDQIGSTNDEAASLARQGAPHGSVVLAREQSAGHGRWRRPWVSRAGGLYLSMILREQAAEKRVRSLPSGSQRVCRETGPKGSTAGAPREERGAARGRGSPGESLRIALLPLAASVALAEALDEVCGARVRLRWPNDLYWDERKLAGILCESSFSGSDFDFAVVGCGVNVNQRAEDFPAELAGRATSLAMRLGREIDPLELAAHLCRRLDRWWATMRFEPGDVTESFAAWSGAERGERIRVKSRDGARFMAEILGIAADGALRVKDTDGRERSLYSEEVVYLEAAGRVDP